MKGWWWVKNSLTVVEEICNSRCRFQPVWDLCGSVSYTHRHTHLNTYTHTNTHTHFYVLTNSLTVLYVLCLSVKSKYSFQCELTQQCIVEERTFIRFWIERYWNRKQCDKDFVQYRHKHMHIYMFHNIESPSQPNINSSIHSQDIDIVPSQGCDLKVS